MSIRIQLSITKEAKEKLDELVTIANKGFNNGKISLSDAINEMILTSKVDITELQNKNIDIRQTLKTLSKKDDIDIEDLIKTLHAYKGKAIKRKKASSAKEEVTHG